MKLVGADGAGGLLDVGHRGAGPAHADVVGHRALEQEALLGDGDDGAPQVGLGEVAQVDAVEQHAALGRVPEAGRQPGDGGLAGAGGADDGERLPGRDREVEVVEHRALPVAELDGLEADLAVRRRPAATGSIGSGHARRLRQHPRQLLERPPTRPGTGCRTGSAPPSARRTAAGRAGRRPARPRSWRRRARGGCRRGARARS